jgi:predicted membrane-bound mannosyltransferase
MPNGATLKRILAAGWLLLYYSRLLRVDLLLDNVFWLLPHVG